MDLRFARTLLGIKGIATRSKKLLDSIYRIKNTFNCSCLLEIILFYPKICPLPLGGWP